MKRIIPVIILFILGALNVNAQYGMMDYYGGGMFLFGWIFGLLLLIIMVLFIIWLVKEIQKKR